LKHIIKTHRRRSRVAVVEGGIMGCMNREVIIRADASTFGRRIRVVVSADDGKY